jgi:Glycosyltransferase like family
MIAFGSAITKPEIYRRAADVGIRLAAEPDSEIYPMTSIGSIFRSYNALLEQAAEREDLEALVLVHQDTQIVDEDFCARARWVLRDPDVGIAGCVGAVGVRSIAWWEGSVSFASFIHRFDDHGGGDLPAFSWAMTEAPPYARTGEVDTVDGFLLVLSPWVVRNVRFDESLGQFHGYDFDFCLQVRAAGRKVVTTDFRAIHNHALEPFDDPESWIAAHIKVAEKWDGRMPGVGTAPGAWEERALRAEALRDAARLTGHSELIKSQAVVRELERALAETTDSISWRITAPLRSLRRLMPVREGRRAAPGAGRGWRTSNPSPAGGER